MLIKHYQAFYKKKDQMIKNQTIEIGPQVT